MLFSSLPFLYWFLPGVIILYFIAPKGLKNAVLLLSSLLFYAWGEPRYVLLMVLSILLSYVLGLLIGKYRQEKPALSRLFLVLAVLFGIFSLGWFKYADFFVGNFNALTGLSIPLLKIALPIGISFYTFQLMSYSIDVYRGKTEAQKNPITLGAYIALFPQLIAGPIVRYSDVQQQLGERIVDVEGLSQGIRRFILGLGKKVLIANTMGELCALYQATADNSVLFTWLYAIAYTLQIYFDFSGYSDMAIGLGRIFGFRFTENFDHPYVSRSITEFWRRWHISLGVWFRDYVYIPMGGNRVSRPRWYFNILVVWMLTGFWHGAAWNFIIWGLYFALFLVIEKHWLLKRLEKAPVLSHIYVLLLVVISFVIFNAPDMAQAGHCLAGMFGMAGLPLVSAEALYYLRSYALILIIAIIGSTPLCAAFVEALRKRGFEKLINLLEIILLAVLFLTVTAFLVDGSFNPFLYFRF